MTNTRITDPEIFERRYPVVLREFSLRKGSGGEGLYRGGDGVVRDIEFLEPIQASILSEVGLCALQHLSLVLLTLALLLASCASTIRYERRVTGQVRSQPLDQEDSERGRRLEE